MCSFASEGARSAEGGSAPHAEGGGKMRRTIVAFVPSWRSWRFRSPDSRITGSETAAHGVYSQPTRECLPGVDVTAA